MLKSKLAISSSIKIGLGNFPVFLVLSGKNKLEFKAIHKKSRFKKLQFVKTRKYEIWLQWYYLDTYFRNYYEERLYFVTCSLFSVTLLKLKINVLHELVSKSSHHILETARNQGFIYSQGLWDTRWSKKQVRERSPQKTSLENNRISKK